LDNGRVKLVSPENRVLFFDRIKDKNDSMLQEVGRWMAATYGEKEDTGTEWIGEALARENPDWLFVAVNGHDELYGYVHAEYLPLSGNQRLLYFCYVDAEDALKLAMVESVYLEALAYAEERGEEIAAILVETDEGWEWPEKAGLLTPCIKRGKKHTEVPYLAPPMEWFRNGKPKFAALPNRLKLWLAKLDVHILLAVIFAMYEQFIKYDEFSSEKARRKAEEEVSRLFANLAGQVSGGELVLLTEAQCQALGKKFFRHAA